MFGRQDKSKLLRLIPELDRTEFIDDVSIDKGVYLVRFVLSADDSSEPRGKLAAEARQQLSKSVPPDLIGQKYLIAQLANQQLSAAEQAKSSFVKLQLSSLAGYVLIIIGALVVALTDRITTQLTMSIIVLIGTVLSAYLASTLLPQYRDAVKRAEKLEDRLERCSEQIPERQHNTLPTIENA